MPASHTTPSKRRPRHTCGKRHFGDRISAELALAYIWRDPNDDGRPAPRAAYDCPTCSGWHLTSQKPRSRRPVHNGPETKTQKLVRGKEHKVMRYVADYRAVHEHGPTWSELAVAFGWSPGQGAHAIRYLTAQGWLASTGRPRSLRPGRRSA
ncbi:hypothetical protein [Streptomyces fractus]|uniref:hypothetical protein n=1 Tax=Streptomyces fractus TaxID=641806 RepID=UPI003CF98743